MDSDCKDANCTVGDVSSEYNGEAEACSNNDGLESEIDNLTTDHTLPDDRHCIEQQPTHESSNSLSQPFSQFSTTSLSGSEAVKVEVQEALLSTSPSLPNQVPLTDTPTEQSDTVIQRVTVGDGIEDSDSGKTPSVQDNLQVTPSLNDSQRHTLLDTSLFESPGLLYAGDDWVDIEQEMKIDSAIDVLQEEVNNHKNDLSDEPEESFSTGHLLGQYAVRQFPPVDPHVLLDLENHSQRLGIELDQLLEGLKTNLHAMSVCTHQAISLQRESVDNLQETVDSNVKVMYSFLSKFNDLHSNLKPVQGLAKQIQDINEALKVLEKLF